MNRSLAFYSGLLGMNVVLDTEMAGEMLSKEVGLENAHLRLVELASTDGPVLLELLQYLHPVGTVPQDGVRCCDVGADHVALIVNDIQVAYRNLVDADVRFTCEPQKVDAGYFEGHWTAYCADPDDLIVELWQLPDRALG
jgi:catechol 2,3-dioxygenase-like lactoylglutathione lyase family enzyme